MVPALPAVVARFDVEKVKSKTGSNDYGLESWKTVFQTVPVQQATGTWLFEGDTAGRTGRRVWCCGFMAYAHNERTLTSLRDALSKSKDFIQVAADPPFLTGDACASEPLIGIGRIAYDGKILREENEDGWAWDAIKRLQSTK
jgi:hypothetical protein